MRKSALLPAGLLLAVASSTLAGPTPVGSVKAFDSFGAAGGGEFLVTSTNFIPGFNPGSLGESAGKFETFCLERFEDIVFNTELQADLNDRTVANSGNIFYNGTMANSHGGVQDAISNQTAYLYEKFITHSLNNYDYGSVSLREEDATALQAALWFFEQEIDGTTNAQALAWISEANTAVRDGYRNLGQVAVLNLYTSNARSDYQDVLVYVPLPPAAWAGLAMLGIVGLGQIRRRQLQKA